MSKTTNAVMMNNGDDMIPGTGWNWADAVDAAAEHERAVRANPDLVDRVLARYDAEPVDLGDQVSAEALELAAEVAAEHRLHPRAIDRVMHRHGECACFAR